MSAAPDLVVIGGGIAGASIAYELAASRSVLLLEAEPTLAVHSTARSAATYIPGHGTAPVRALIAASGPRFAVLADALRDGSTPLLIPRPVLWAAFDDAGERALRTLLAERAGEPDAPRPVTTGEALRRCPVLRPDALRGAGLTEISADVDAMALHQAYIRGLRRRGGTVRAGARVTAVRATATGWRVEATGTGGAARAAAFDVADVVDAAGAWADVVATMAGVPPIGLTPLRRTIAVARVPDPARLGIGAGTPLPMVVEAGERFYFKAEGEHLLVSPGDETPAEPGDARPCDLDVATALERAEAVTGLGLRSIRTSWAGLRSFVSDRSPVVGSRPEHPGFHFFAGQGGSGIESAPALAALGAAVITGGPVPADIPVDPAVLGPARLS
ncbi:NAD(P)/FAD-dependent oxidoreductase [Pseudonocardia bannensis]|uniref:FAD-binding oxidoreductase n=1 Tax=Pseudonocardia bannensis TaxID=630973 RepID=A0A848DN39_9PSEU|nr:FAD-dependent oxidoreductase [Pseudonocardia bannensis]NMH94220.1 FAD-binding oxidoreductase [Pseudonocardia bannensis]